MRTARALTLGARGVPARPGAWLTTGAQRRALDPLRRAADARGHAARLIEPTTQRTPDLLDPTAYPTTACGSVCACCHPALAPGGPGRADAAARVRRHDPGSGGGRSWSREPTMAARITRAKKKIAVARHPLRVPRAAELPGAARRGAAVVHLLVTTGHAAPSATA